VLLFIPFKNVSNKHCEGFFIGIELVNLVDYNYFMNFTFQDTCVFVALTGSTDEGPSDKIGCVFIVDCVAADSLAFLTSESLRDVLVESYRK